MLAGSHTIEIEQALYVNADTAECIGFTDAFDIVSADGQGKKDDLPRLFYRQLPSRPRPRHLLRSSLRHHSTVNQPANCEWHLLLSPQRRRLRAGSTGVAAQRR